MKNSYESFKKLYRAISNILLVGIASVVFILVWEKYYNDGIVFPYYFKGFAMMMVMYAIMISVFTLLLNGSQIGYLRKTNNLVSQGLAVLFTNIVFYFVTVLLTTHMVTTIPFIAFTIGECLMFYLLTAVLNRIFDKIVPELSMVLIYGDHPESEIRRMTLGWSGKYKITDVISIKSGRKKCIYAIKNHDAAVICDVPEDDRNILADYCADKGIPIYFTPKLSDIIFSNAEGLRFFERHRTGLGLLFGFETLSPAKRFSLVGYLKKVYRGTKRSLYDMSEKALNSGRKLFVVTANPETLMTALDNEVFDSILLSEETLIVPDGIGLVKALKIAGYGDYGRIPGVEYASLLLKMADIKNLGVFLYGASQEVIDGMKHLMEKDYPNARLLEAVNGYDDESDAVMERAIEKKPDIILVALGVPAQEKLIAKYLPKFEKGIFVGVGGSFDVLSGKKKRAPKIFLKLNLEWLYRITSEPKRLIRFYNSNVRFLWEILKIKKIR